MFIKFYSYQEPNEAFSEKDRVRVIVRIRPINEFEKSHGDNEIISCDRTSLIVNTFVQILARLKCLNIIYNCVLQQVDGKTQSRKFTFNTVFDPNSIQEEMFNYSGIKRLINMAIDG